MPDQQNQTIEVTKLDAARRQLDTAIKLFFYDGDPVSIHTLTAASHQILHDLSEKRSGKPMILRDMSFIRPGKEKEFRELINRYGNFFKHADKDAQNVLRFNPLATEAYLYDASIRYYELTKENPLTFGAYKVWFSLKHVELVNLPPNLPPNFNELLTSVLGSFADLSKRQFFEMILQVLSKQGLS